MTDLVRYEVARATLAEASSVDEVKDVATRSSSIPNSRTF
jgi:hypothetical protein